ncbi:MAG TPA: sulfatase-like hydrolase/transferase [Rhodanobacteraceae bacterium]|nr:sulfatase-like hydrolase/transferase [Rhodanobacteraceae bacterium]
MQPSTSPNPLWQRFRPLIWLGACFLAISFVTRLTLLLMTGSGVPADPLYWLYAFGAGLGYDLVTFVYFAWPLVLFLWLVPAQRGRMAGWLRWLLYALALLAICAICLGFLRWRYDANWKTAWPVLLPFMFGLPLAAFTYRSRVGQWILYLFCLALVFMLLFTGAAELTFWNEFGTRFNFIAVDYLVYTSEVIGNITESYPVASWLAMLAAAAIAIVVLSRRSLRTSQDASRFGPRTLVVAGWLVVTVVTAFSVDASMKNMTRNTYVNALAGNGMYQFFAAFRNEQLNFHQFYRTLPDNEAYAIVRRLMKTPSSTFLNDDPHDLTRIIRNPGQERDLNVVLITVESLSAGYLGVFGNPGGLTPFLDGLAGKSLFFDHMYANGTRTVRGLEAVTLSVPPTPGNSLIHQQHNENLFSLGSIFNQHGYVSEFVYGGYGEFDNMNYFFAHNGYKDVDRRDIPPTATIHGANVWGVADEDLYTLAMGQMDKIHAEGKPFFLHIMTTSNHRPYTWPKGRVDMPQGKRAGAAKYTDWAIGDFIQRMQAKPYFADTVFVITADHCADSSGSTRIPVDRYHIPLFIYSPAHIAPRVVGNMMSQIDIAPTLLGLLHFNYRSRFFGYNVLDLHASKARAFPSTYANLGELHDGRLTILMPGRKVMQVKPDPETGTAVPYKQVDPTLLDQAIAYYQVAYDEFETGRMRWRPGDGTPVPKPQPPVTTAPTDTTSAP